MKQLFWKLMDLGAGRRGLQGMYALMHRVAVHGMNYGRGGDIRTSGELDALQYVKRALAREQAPVLFDVGANMGHYTVQLADVFGPKSQVHAFEPSASTSRILLETIGGRNGIRTHQVGMSDKQGSLKLYHDAGSNALASVYQRDLDHYGLKMDTFEEIQLTTIDTFCDAEGIDRIHFLKLDVEGHELSALQGAARMLQEERIDFIQFEFGGCNIDSRTFYHDFHKLLDPQYSIHRIVRNGLYPVGPYHEGLEIFSTINYLAERRNRR
jgi:FkbM family methyltransferase